MKVEHLAPRFFREVLEMEYSDCLVTDESDLRDFCEIGSGRQAVENLLGRLKAHYLIDGHGAGSTRIVDLLELLERRGVGS